MKIIFSSYDSINNPSYGGGGAVAIHEIAKRLTYSHEVTIIAGAYPGCRSHLVDGIEYQYVGFSHGNPKINQIVYQLVLPLYALTSIFDIWMEGFTPPFATAFLPLFTRKPVVGITHFLDAEEKSKEYKLPFTWIQSLGLKCYQHVVVLTEQQKEKVLHNNPRASITIIPNGTNLAAKKASTLGDYLLYMGRLEIGQKGLDLLLEAFTKIPDDKKKLLYLAGHGQHRDEEKIKLLINKYKLDRWVIMLGKISGDEKNNLLHRAIGLVVSSRFEGQSLSIIESLVLGTPIVSFDIDGLKWLDNNVALKAKMFDVNELGQNIIKLTENKHLRFEMSKHCYSISKKFSWDAVARQYQQYIESVAKI